MRCATVKPLELPPGRRVLAVSDIHSNADFLRKLLEKTGFCARDILILMGDFTEKRAGGLETLRYIMRLCRQDNVYALSGNCDSLSVDFADGTTGISRDFFGWYFQHWGGQCLLGEMAQVLNFPLDGQESWPAFRKALLEAFTPELDFLRALPTILVNDRFLFVHGGVPREDRLEDLDRWRCMKNDSFLTQGHAFRRWVVVGHWPVTLYHTEIQDASPIILSDQHIISIDGGCSLKLDGQLNALVIPPDGSDHFSWIGYDGLPSVVALDAQQASEGSMNIRWHENKVEVLSREGEFCRCRHLASGRELDILTEFLYERGGALRCQDATDYELPVTPGDRLSLVRRTGRGILAKKNGVTGWYRGRFQS